MMHRLSGNRGSNDQDTTLKQDGFGRMAGGRKNHISADFGEFSNAPKTGFCKFMKANADVLGEVDYYYIL